MLQWFNKQEKSRSSAEKQRQDRQNSPSSNSCLTEENYEFLFNQLLDGVAHGWHLIRIVKFFDSLESRSNIPDWIAWLNKFEQKIVYANDPSQRRVGAIMMRFNELTQTDSKLKELGQVFQRIGKKLFIGDTSQLIWEYDGMDLVVLETTTEETTIQNTEEDNKSKQILDDFPELISELIDEPDREVLTDTSKTIDRSEENIELKNQTESIPQSTSNPDFVSPTEKPANSEEAILPQNSEIRDGRSIESLEALTKQLTVLQDVSPENETVIQESDEPESINLTRQPPETDDLATESSNSEDLNDSVPKRDEPELPNLTRQPSETDDLATENPSSEDLDNSASNVPKIGSPESLEALTQQLTALQDTSLQSSDRDKNDTLLELDEEPTLLETEDTQTDASASLSVASFLEATKALVPQQKKRNVTPLSWEEFIAVLEQDPSLAKQVAEYLQISSLNPQDIVQAAINRLTKQEKNHLDPATLELVESWFNLGLKQVSAEDFQGAIASWDKALRLNPNLSEAWHNRGSALGRLGKYEEAIQSFNKAINIAPERYQAWNDRAHALYQIQKWQQSVESWDKALSIMPDHYQFWYNRGCALEQLQRYDESISSYEKALEIKPDFQPARTRYINLVTENSSSSAN